MAKVPMRRSKEDTKPESYTSDHRGLRLSYSHCPTGPA